MTQEQWERGEQIKKEVEELTKSNKLAKVKSDRVKDYIDYLKDEKIRPVAFAGKTYPKVDIKFFITYPPTDSDVRDMFSLAGENLEDFIEFLKKCKKNYDNEIKRNSVAIEALQKEFERL